ncbi:MAG: 2TM domain-containing protein [Anaerolineales bacterium]|nr:2TM domain-containing protein [Anaerolineales bacterium]MCB9128368.1 2TM domain-containing protein [Ardenticatenales bacterium]MCB9172180.1 2TM domain-containing protein [Ardenticatenales bacterium]
MAEKRYSEDAAREILKRASDVQLKESDFSDSHLAQMARELGISENALVLAKEQYLVDEEQRDAEREEAALQVAFEKYRRKDFSLHLFITAIIIPMVIVLNLLISPGFLWFIIPLVGLLLSLVGHYWWLQHDGRENYDQQYQRWLKGQHRRKKALTP